MLKRMGSDDEWNFDVVQDEKTLILRGAYEYIEKLQRQVQELHSELDSDSCFSDDESCCSDDGSCCRDDDDDDDDVSSCEDDLSTEELLVDSNVAVLEASRAECSGCSHFTVGFCRLLRFFFDYQNV